MSKVRVRYAPSPTGYLHIGGARSALFNYLYAKRHKGDFILRIEDTDIERNIEGAEQSQIEDLQWLGIFADESPNKTNKRYAPYRQSEKLDVYVKYAKQLVEAGYAYYCYCSEEELEQRKQADLAKGIASPQYNQKCLHLSEEEIEAYKKAGRVPTIRLQMPDNDEITFTDLVRGEVSFNTKDIGDWVLIKSNGIATYNFAVVIDDHFMDISHVLRGEEHLSNTPKQIQLYKNFNWQQPKFGHMTIIVNETGKKLSKRDQNILQFMSQYRELGYLPEAIFNFILLLGWSPGGEEEIFTMDEAIEIFTLERLSRSPSTFDPGKLMWMNSYYIKNLSDEDYLAFIKPFVTKALGEGFEDDYYLMVANIFKNDIKYGHEIVDLITPVIKPNQIRNKEHLNLLASEGAQNVIKAFKKLLAKAPDLENETIKVIFNKVKDETGEKGKTLYQPVRLALTSETSGLEMVSVFKILGKEVALERLEKALKV